MTFVIILLIAAGLAAGAYFYLPTWIGKSVGSGRIPDFFPDEIKELASGASKNLDAIDPVLSEMKLSRRELGNYVEGIEEEAFRDFVERASADDVDSPAALLDLAEKTVGLPPEMDRQKALELMEANMDESSLAELKKGLTQIPTEGPKFKLMFPAMKRTFAETLMSSGEQRGKF